MEKLSGFLIVLFAIVSTGILPAQNILFVNAYVVGGAQDASSWANATPDLQLALDLASAGDVIWVAQGAYYATSTLDRSASFYLKQGVRLYGGFAGNETGLLERDFSTHETVLSGNIGDQNSLTDNTLHILRGFGLDSTTVLDGFTVTQGYAYGQLVSPDDGQGGGLLLQASPLMANTSPVIQNCRFVGNYASVGGAIYCRWNFEHLVNPIIRNCLFERNRSFNFAGAFYKGSPAAADRPFVLENCIFRENRSYGGEGGAVFLTQLGHTNVFRNCLFERDTTSATWGGGIYCSGYALGYQTTYLVLDSCDFLENFASEGVGFVYEDLSDLPRTLYCTIKNCNFERNRTNGGGGAPFYMYTFKNSMVILTVENTRFISNRSNTYASLGLEVAKADVKFRNCVFEDNRHINNPVATHFSLYIIVYEEGNVALSNCLLARNGSGVFMGSPDTSRVVSYLNNCTFFSNGRYPFEKSYYASFSNTDEFYNDCYVNNCIFWEPDADNVFTNSVPFQVSLYDYFIEYSALSLADGALPGGQAALGDNILFKDQYPMFVDTVNDDFRLLPCSPAVNTASNAIAAQLGLETDLDGFPRIFQDTIDMGAYEVQDSCPASVTIETPGDFVEIKIFPNPVKERETFRVKVSSYEGSAINWILADITGRMVKNGQAHFQEEGVMQLTAPDCPGLYFLYLAGMDTPLRCIVEK